MLILARLTRSSLHRRTHHLKSAGMIWYHRSPPSPSPCRGCKVDSLPRPACPWLCPCSRTATARARAGDPGRRKREGMNEIMVVRMGPTPTTTKQNPLARRFTSINGGNVAANSCRPTPGSGTSVSSCICLRQGSWERWEVEVLKTTLRAAEVVSHRVCCGGGGYEGCECEETN
jgi:hypothetical protein